jgi:MFS family permease
MTVDIAIGRAGDVPTGLDSIARKVAWRIMPLILVCYLFAYFDRIIVSFAKFHLQSALDLSDTAYGLGVSLFSLGYVLFEVPSNMLLYRVGARRWIARILISWGLATAAMIFITTEWQFYVMRFLIGMFEAGFAPGILYFLTLWFPSAYRGRITSLLFLAPAFSGILGAPLSGLILAFTDGVLGMPSWHWLFLAGGLPCVLLGLLVLVRFVDRVEDAKWLSRSEKVMLAERIALQNRQIRGGHSLLEAIRSPGLLSLGLIYFIIQIGSYGLNFWTPHIIKTAGVSDPAVIGVLTAIPYICGAISMTVIGRLADASGDRRKYVAFCLVTAVIGFIAACVFDKNIVFLCLALVVMGAGVVASIPAFWALPPKLLTGAGAAGGIALVNTLGQLGGLVSPVMVGYIHDVTGSVTPALYVIAGLCGACAVFLMYGLPDQLKRKDSHVEPAAQRA